MEVWGWALGLSLGTRVVVGEGRPGPRVMVEVVDVAEVGGDDEVEVEVEWVEEGEV